ncbi:MAG: hypothetical protein R3Y07_09790 [Eubacteriales bacterium]
MKQNHAAIHRLQESTGCSYAKACEALEHGEATLLDAYLYLEESGHVPPPTVHTFYSTKREVCPENKQEKDKKSFDFAGRDTFRTLSHELFRNNIALYTKADYFSQVPVFLLLVAVFSTYGIILLAMLFSMLFGITYRFSDQNSILGDYNPDLLELSSKISGIGDKLFRNNTP